MKIDMLIEKYLNEGVIDYAKKQAELVKLRLEKKKLVDWKKKQGSSFWNDDIEMDKYSSKMDVIEKKIKAVQDKK